LSACRWQTKARLQHLLRLAARTRRSGQGGGHGQHRLQPRRRPPPIFPPRDTGSLDCTTSITPRRWSRSGAAGSRSVSRPTSPALWMLGARHTHARFHKHSRPAPFSPPPPATAGSLSLSASPGGMEGGGTPPLGFTRHFAPSPSVRGGPTPAVSVATPGSPGHPRSAADRPGFGITHRTVTPPYSPSAPS